MIVETNLKGVRVASCAFGSGAKKAAIMPGVIKSAMQK